MRVVVEFSTRTSRTPYVVGDVKKTEETQHCFVVTTRKGEILRFPWTSIAWAKTETQ